LGDKYQIRYKGIQADTIGSHRQGVENIKQGVENIKQLSPPPAIPKTKSPVIFYYRANLFSGMDGT